MNVILQVFVIFAAAKAAGEVFVRLRQPAIVGELLVGVMLGPHLLGWVEVNGATNALSQVGIVVLLFTAGLETKVSDLVSVGRTAAVASVAGILAAGGTGFGVVAAFGYSTRAALLAGVGLAASSVGIAARAFGDLGCMTIRPARVVLGAAVVDDIVVLALLPLAQGLSSGRSVLGLLVGVAGAIGFVVLVSAIGPRLARRHSGVLARPRIGRGPFVLSLGLCLGLAALAEQVGLAALVGAFLAGMVLAETPDHDELERRMEPLFDFLVPFFFVVSAAHVDPGDLADAGAPFLVALVAVTLAAKLGGCGLGALGLSLRERLTVGVGMLPRAEVTLAVAGAGLAAHELPAPVFSALLAAVLVSTLLAPPLLKVTVPEREQRLRRRPPDVPPEAGGPGKDGDE